MTDTEYRLLKDIAATLDILDDLEDDIYDLHARSTEAYVKIGETFHEIKENNLDEWNSMQKVEARIIESKHRIKRKEKSNA